MLPASLAFISKSVQTESEKILATSWWAAAGGIAVVLGPVLGGILTSAVGWQSVFCINIPICIICLIYLMCHRVEDTPIKRSFDIVGQILGAFFLLSITAGIVEFHHGILQAVILLCVGLILGVIFLVYEVKVQHPAFPLILWKNLIFDSCVFTGFSLNVSYFGAIFVLGLLFQASYHLTPAITGMLFIPLTIFIMAANLASGKISEKYDTFLPLFGGQVIEALGFLCIAYAIFIHNLIIMSIAMPFVGIGAGLASPPMMSTLLRSVADEDIGLASGALNCLRQFGTVLGVALFGLFIEGDMNFGAGISLIISGVILLISSLGTLLFIPRRIR